MGQAAVITSTEAARCQAILEAQDQPITAIQIAVRLGLAGCRESRRRRVRAIIKHLREVCGVRIVATLSGGYWITEDDNIWRQWLEDRAIDAKIVLGEVYRRKKAAAERGQGLLFAPIEA